MCTVLSNNEGLSGIEASADLLAAGAPVLDALEAGVRLVEADPAVWTVGRGGWPNLLGAVELDASVMDGDTLRSGAVVAVNGEPGNHYWLWRDGFAAPQRHEARIAPLHPHSGSAATTHARAERHARAAAALKALGGTASSAGSQFSGDPE